MLVLAAEGAEGPALDTGIPSGADIAMLVSADMLNVTTGCRVRSGRLTRTSRGVDEHLCSESGARLNSQAGDKMY